MTVQGIYLGVMKCGEAMMQAPTLMANIPAPMYFGLEANFWPPK